MTRSTEIFDVVVVGGGHAGCEAAAVAARIGARVALATFSRETIGAMSCNPAIGGLGKGHLVREVDAFDGVIARAADDAAIHHRMLNASKGAAVHGPRVQADRKLFARSVQRRINALDNLSIIEGEAADIALSPGGGFRALLLADGSEVAGRTLVLATGTFLGGRLFRGEERGEGGRDGERAATRLGERLIATGIRMGRLKTGTPPRLDGRTVDWARLERQPSDTGDWTMAFANGARRNPQLSCAITHTNAATHAIILGASDRSPMLSGGIDARGPRYCPSIEDKVTRFADRDRHQIFLEPEGLDTHLVYPNGISTSLPLDAQQAMIRSIVGLERADIVAPGYAVEYGHVDPRELDVRLELGAIPGVFCAGQINGTTGYEEAAAQGLVAGANAAASALSRDPLIVDRADGYLGVMLDDLVVQGVTEPYRMLTARAEFRLRLRADNAVLRLGDKALAIGCVGDSRESAMRRHRDAYRGYGEALGSRVTVPDARALGIELADDAGVLSAADLARFPGFDDRIIARHLGIIAEEAIERHAWNAAIEDAVYAPYIARQDAEVRELRAAEARTIPADIDYRAIGGLSAEMTERLESSRPDTIGMASRIHGITPAALTAIYLHVRKRAA